MKNSPIRSGTKLRLLQPENIATHLAFEADQTRAICGANLVKLITWNEPATARKPERIEDYRGTDCFRYVDCGSCRRIYTSRMKRK